MKRRILCVILSAMLAGLTLCGCNAGQADQGSAEEVGVPNPIKEVSGPADFEPLGVYIEAPESATEASYSTISDKIAQVRFKMNGKTYTYRASKSAEDISGVFEKFDDLEQDTHVDADDWTVSINVKTVSGGEKGALASWSFDDVQYTLYTGDAVDADSVSTLALKLVDAIITRVSD